MPIYVFKCKDCGCIFEIFVSNQENEKEVKCINCGSKNLVKQFAPFGLGKTGLGKTGCKGKFGFI